MNILRRSILVASLFVSIDSHSATPNADGDYVIRYTDSAGNIATYVFVPRNKVVATVNTTIIGGVSFDFKYTVMNSAQSAQSIELIELPILKASLSFTPANSTYGTAPSDFFFSSDYSNQGTTARWNGIYSMDTTLPPTNIAPGAQRDSFKLSLPAMGGIGKMRILGYVPDPPCTVSDCSNGSGGDEDYPELDQQLSELTTTANFVEALVAIPAFPFGPATGFSAGDSFVMFKTELNSWPAISQSSSTFANQASGRIDDISNALSQGNSVAVRAKAADFKVFVQTQSSSEISTLGALIINANLDGLVASLDSGSGSGGGKPPSPIYTGPPYQDPRITPPNSPP